MVKLFKFTFDLKQYVVAKLFLERKNICNRTKYDYCFGGNWSSHGYDISQGWQKHYQRLLEITWKQARNESFKVHEMEQLY